MTIYCHSNAEKHGLDNKMKKPSIVYVMPVGEYNTRLAEILKGLPEFVAPDWIDFVKSGHSKVRPPQDPEFWFKRAASVLRQVYTQRVVGVNRLRTRYGGRKKRGSKPEHFYKSSGKMLRVILQQAEKAGLLEKHNEPGKRAGRKLTKEGTELMEGVK
ncbi:40S ribosomal protein S19 [Candidatus Pacearchaeota archaeon]|nr:40S ribosomal protein S19 [Candidatus Pacearchaeota archaeon]